MTGPSPVDELMQRVAARAAWYRRADARDGLALPEPLPALSRPEAPRAVPQHPRVGLHELLSLRGGDVVSSAYERLLWRCASPEELAFRLELFRSGRQDVFTLIHDLRHSPEGIRCGVRITGKGWRRIIFAVLRLPMGRRMWLGLRALFALPRLRVDIGAELRRQDQRVERIEHALGGFGPKAAHDPETAQALRCRLAALERRVAVLEQTVDRP